MAKGGIALSLSDRVFLRLKRRIWLTGDDIHLFLFFITSKLRYDSNSHDFDRLP